MGTELGTGLGTGLGTDTGTSRPDEYVVRRACGEDAARGWRSQSTDGPASTVAAASSMRQRSSTACRSSRVNDSTIASVSDTVR